MWVSWLVISAIVRTIVMGFIIFSSVYLIGVIFGKNTTPNREEDIGISIVVLSISGAIFYLFQFILPT